MRRHKDALVSLRRLTPLAFLLLALQAPGASGQTVGFGASGPCVTTVIGGNFGGSYLDTTKGPACKAAIPAFRSAAVIVIGDTNDNDIAGWLSAVVSKPAWKAKFDEGFKFSDAVAFLKERIATQGAAERAKAIDNAFMEVYGGPSKPEEQAYWEAQVKAQTAWYATITGTLVKELQGNGFKKQLAIIRAYKAVFGREPTVGDGQYWQARNDHYRLIREANRAWLYSPQGAKDLVETTARALQAKTGQKPTDADVKKAMAKFTDGRLIYEEMVKK